MGVGVGLWRVDGDFQRIGSSVMPSEQRLEALIESDPSVLGETLLILGRQVQTAHGKWVDLLGVNADGELHVLELKRDKTPRDVVAQTLDYGSWVAGLSHEDVLTLYEAHQPGRRLEEDFAEHFGTEPPEQWNTAHMLTIVAAEVDDETERIVTYLAEEFGVPINVAFFRYFADGDREYVARTWLRTESGTASVKGTSAARAKEPWNGRDWYVAFGVDSDSRSWADALRYDFVSAGGGDWYSRTLRGLPEGASIWVHIPKVGYVGHGTVTGPAVEFDQAKIDVDGAPIALRDLQREGKLEGKYVHDNEEPEYVVPVRWEATRTGDEAVWRTGMFANQNSACKLRNKFTLDVLEEAFAAAE